MRVVSFLPSATEILYALGLGDDVAGITYECDYPPEARSKPVVVRTRLPHSSSAAEIDARVSEFTARGESLYQVDAAALAAIQPDLIITQDICRVCAASPGDLPSVLGALPKPPRVLTLTPRALAQVWNDIRLVGKAVNRAARAETLATELERRVAAVERAVADGPRPRVLCLEWLDPPFVAGHWVPEMVERAGGTEVLGRKGEPSFRVGWEKALAAQPEAVVVMPCGYSLGQTVSEFRKTKLPAGWAELPAVRQSRVYAVDATSYFSRPGPRLAAGVEILARLLHPERAPLAPPPESVAPLRR